MTREEARKIVGLIKDGQPLRTRFQEESWGVAFEKDNGRFRYESSRMVEVVDENGRFQMDWETTERFYLEADLITFFEKLYRYDVLIRWFRDQ